jgi:hypothetical protein
MPEDKWAKYAATPAAPAAEDKWSKFAATPGAVTPEPEGTKTDLSKAGTISAQPSFVDRMKTAMGNFAMNPMQGPPSGMSALSGIENYTPEGRAEHPILSRVGDVTKGAKDYGRLLATTIGVTGGAGIGGPAAMEAVGEATVGKLATKVEPLAKVNKLLGVGEADVIPGKVPSSLSEFVANPARGATKYGLDAKALQKMNAPERNAAIQAARDKAGQSLDAVLKQASESGKTVDIQKPIMDVFKQITDKKVAVNVQKKFLDIVAQNGINKPLSQLSPTEARAIQRGLDKFADFAGGDTVESMKQAATQLRRGISQATRKAVPESAEFDQDYTDLHHASEGTQKLLKEWATKVPENKLRNFIIKAAIGGGAAGLGYEGAKLWGKTTPVP